jgi:DNA repair photolyase
MPDPLKGRGAVTRIAHRFDSLTRAADGDWLDWTAALDPDDPDALAAPALRTRVSVETARSLITSNDSPDIPFDRSINPYRGCEHGCVYCYARPTHSYLNLSPGLDFESRLVAKRNAAQLLARELAAPAYRPALIALGTATDAYQPVERELRLTRGVLEVLADTLHPVGIVTKGALIERDLDLLVPMARAGVVQTFVSITTLDAELSRRLEPRAASPARRLRTVRALADAGIPVHVNFAPVIPFINEPELERVLEAAAEAGARRCHYTVVRLPWEVAPLFQEWLEAHYPERAARVMARIREMRGGRDYEARFGARMKGQGVWAELIRTRFEAASRRQGFEAETPPLRTDAFRPPAPPPGSQLGLF